jgi:hypothetical protein
VIVQYPEPTIDIGRASLDHLFTAARRSQIADCYFATLEPSSSQAALAHLGERQTEVNFGPFLSPHKKYSGGTVFDPQKRHSSFVLLPHVATCAFFK